MSLAATIMDFGNDLLQNKENNNLTTYPYRAI